MKCTNEEWENIPTEDKEQEGDISREEFSRRITEALKTVSPGELADTFGVTRGTVERWVSGVSVPHTLARPNILERIEKRVTTGVWEK